MLANFVPFLVAELARLVEDRNGNEGLAHIMQQRRARQPALIVLAHPEMLRECRGEARDKQAVAITVGVMTADRGQPFTQRRSRDGLKNLTLRLHHVAECKRNSGWQPLEDLHQHGVSCGNAPVQHLAARRRTISVVVRKCGADTL